MNAPILTDKVYNLWVLLHQTRDAIFKVRDKELAKHGISPAEAAALFIIQATGENVTPIEISRWMLREPHTVTGLLNRMEKKGLVRRSKDRDRKNLVRVSLTEKGKQVYNQSTERGSINSAISALSGPEQQQLGSYLQKLRDQALKELELQYVVPFPPQV